MPSLDRTLFDQVMMPNYAPSDIIPVRGQGSRVWDQNDKEYIDFAAGIAVTSLGHQHPVLVKALKDQADKIWHLSNVMTNEPALYLAKKLCENTFAERVFLSNSGAEANEAALKLARRWASTHYSEKKNEIVSTYNSFHGRTLFTVSVGGQDKYLDGFRPAPGGILHAPYNDLEAMKKLVSQEKTAAIIVEPIQGEGGIIPADTAYLSGLRQLCDENNALLIFDEVQTGAGRTGYLYNYQAHNVVPDILTSAKGLGGGVPIGAALTTASIAEALAFGTHGSTYGGNPLVCAVAGKVLDIITNPDLLDAVKTKHEQFKKRLLEMKQFKKVFKEVRGSGLLIGLEVVPELSGNAKLFVQAAAKHGLMVLVSGPNVVRFTPSLIISDEDIMEGLHRFELAVNEVAGQMA